MNINTRPMPRTPQSPAPQAENKTFNYNAQDSAVVPEGDTMTLSVDANGGKPSTDTVKLANKKGIFFFGRLIALRDDPNYKLNPNEDGNYVYGKENPTFTGSNAFSAAAATVNKYNQVLGDLTGKKINWAFGEQKLGISPETGEWPNAFYAREQKGVHFFDVKTTSTGNSGEVASHEVGHAILDAMRPNYLTGAGPETGAFHEAFGDVMAMLMTLGNEKAVDKIVEQTGGGDLSAKRNALSDMGEDFGNVLGLENGKGIRTAFNNFTYKDPATLPERGSETQLGSEVHDFARLWAGAFYDVVDGIADANRAAGMSPKQALMAAGEEGWKLVVGQIEKSSAGSETTFKNMATSLMASDAEYNGGARQDIIRNVMTRRELMSEGEGLFKSAGLEFSGKTVNKQLVLGDDFGELAGVKMDTVVDKPLFEGMFAFGPTAGGSPDLSSETRKGVKMMMDHNEILFTDKAKPGFDEIFKADGTAYRAYVGVNENGEKELHRVPIAVCNFGNVADEHGHQH